MAPRSAAALIAWMCLAEILSMTGFSAYPALLPVLRQLWRLSGFQAGLIGGAFFFGYMLAVPLLSSLTDRVDARRVFAASCLLALIGCAGFAIFAQGTFSGAFFQALTGAGLAGTYMPGLKALTDRLSGPRTSRTIAFYTASFGIGSSVSLVLAGWIGSSFSWQRAFGWLALGPLLAAVIVLRSLRPVAPPAAPRRSQWRSWLAVLADRELRRYVLGYAAHCWELFGLRSWIVAFLDFAVRACGPIGGIPPVLSAPAIAALINLLGLPASILGNEAAMRFGRPRWIAAVMCSAAVLSWVTPLAAGAPIALLVSLLAIYVVCVMGDSAALTAGMVACASPSERGAAMAVHSFLGFGAGFIAPTLFGATLDAAGGGRAAWTLAFALLSSAGLVWVAAARRRLRDASHDETGANIRD